jgi:tetratricopeptide (TPR) repeat protein
MFQLYWQFERSRREAARISRIRSANAMERGQLGRSGYLYPYEFDTAVTKYQDIKSIIDHHERSKQLVSSFYRALYDLRSGIVLRMVWVIQEALERNTNSFGLELDFFAPYQLLRSSCGDIDPRKQSIEYLQSATRHDPSLAEAYYQLGVIHRTEHRLDEALRCLQTATGLAPTMLPGPADVPLIVRAHYEAGLVLRDLNRFGEALGSFERAVELAPEFSDAHRMLAEEFRRIRRYARVSRHFHRAMFYRPPVPLLPLLPPRLAAAPPLGAGRFFEPEIVGPLLDRPVLLPPISVALHRGFRVFKLFDQTYAVPKDDGPIQYPSLLAQDHAVMFVSPEWDKVIGSINEFLGQ